MFSANKKCWDWPNLHPMPDLVAVLDRSSLSSRPGPSSPRPAEVFLRVEKLYRSVLYRQKKSRRCFRRKKSAGIGPSSIPCPTWRPSRTAPEAIGVVLLYHFGHLRSDVARFWEAFCVDFRNVLCVCKAQRKLPQSSARGLAKALALETERSTTDNAGPRAPLAAAA